ncbi:MAG: stage V sporulation protein B [Gorillibacterium sp.]|nr:stage V sporulation protein B [Gorillibacterium sp.]
MILLTAGVVNRLLGFVPRIALPRVIGAEGVGLYQMSYPFLIVVLTLVTGGIPLAVAKLVAEAETGGASHQAKRILGMALLFTLSLSLFFAGICVVSAPYLTRLLFTDPRVFYTFVCIAPIIPIIGVSSVFRGYFQGKQNMIPTAVSQITESLVRIAGMLTLAVSLAPLGLEYAAAGVMVGTLLGEISGMIVLLLQYRKSRTKGRFIPKIDAKNEHEQSRRFILRKVILVSLPVTANRLVGSFSYFFESVLTVQCLAIAGVATAAATMQYGSLQGMIIPVLLLPGVLTYSLSVSLIPTLSEAGAKGDLVTIHKRLHQSLKLALLSGTPFAVFMYVLSDPICYYLYANSEIGVMLRMMAPAALFIYFQGPLQATLQALNHSGKALVNTLIGTIVKLALIFVLASNPSFGILGAIMAIIVNIMLVTVLHWNSVTRLLRFSFPSSEFFKIGLIAVGTGYVCYWIMGSTIVGNPLLRFLITLFAGTVFYIIGILVLKMVDADDLRKLPMPWKK